MRHFCTYFDHHYLARGLALYESLRRHSPECRFWVLCLSESCRAALLKLALPGIEPISLEEFERGDTALAQAKTNRRLIEYYFTCTPALLHFILRQHPEVDCLSYVDSDMYFFGDPEAIFTEIGNNSVAITPHRFPPAMQWREKFGRFNVGWLTFRRDAPGLACLESWRTQCLEWCYDHCEDGRYADQKYLDAWPAQFPGVKVLDHPGINTAPWNLAGCQLSLGAGGLEVNGQPLLLFHFHALKQLTPSIYDPAWPEYAIKPTAILRWEIYAPYLKALEQWRRQTASLTGLVGVPGTARPCGGDRVLSPRRRAWRASPWRHRWYTLLAWGGLTRRKYLLVRNGRMIF